MQYSPQFLLIFRSRSTSAQKMPFKCELSRGNGGLWAGFPCREEGMGRRGIPGGRVWCWCVASPRLCWPVPGSHCLHSSLDTTDVPVLCWQPKCLHFDRATNQWIKSSCNKDINFSRANGQLQFWPVYGCNTWQWKHSSAFLLRAREDLNEQRTLESGLINGVTMASWFTQGYQPGMCWILFSEGYFGCQFNPTESRMLG